MIQTTQSAPTPEDDKGRCEFLILKLFFVIVIVVVYAVIRVVIVVVVGVVVRHNWNLKNWDNFLRYSKNFCLKYNFLLCLKLCSTDLHITIFSRKRM